jgi:hypothetical protein
MQFSAKILVEETKKYFQLSRQIKQAGYNPYLYQQKLQAEKSIIKQQQLFDAELKQVLLKLK